MHAKGRFPAAGLFGVAILAIAFVAVLCRQALSFPDFEHHTIANEGSQMGQTSLSDIDQDGDLDWVVGCADRTGSWVWWFEFKGNDAGWVKHTMGQGNTDVGGCSFDVNGDGWPDQVSGSKLLLNPGGSSEDVRSAGNWSTHSIGTKYSHDTECADVDGDGKLDLIVNDGNNKGQGLFWYTVPANVTSTWPEHTVGTTNNKHGGVSPKGVGDMDGDGDNDIVTANGWWENDGNAVSWHYNPVGDFLGENHQYGVAVKTWVIDADGDGDMDFFQAEADNPDSRVAFFENDGEGSFTRHMIKDKGSGQDFHSLCVADFDNDGDYDVFTGGGPLSQQTMRCYVWENTAGKGNTPTSSDWTEHHIIDKPCHEAMCGDVDGDGDIDICSKPWTTGNEHFYLQNMGIEDGSITQARLAGLTPSPTELTVLPAPQGLRVFLPAAGFHTVTVTDLAGRVAATVSGRSRIARTVAIPGSGMFIVRVATGTGCEVRAAFVGGR